jgi:hypothetical protein
MESVFNAARDLKERVDLKAPTEISLSLDCAKGIIALKHASMKRATVRWY